MDFPFYYNPIKADFEDDSSTSWSFGSEDSKAVNLRTKARSKIDLKRCGLQIRKSSALSHVYIFIGRLSKFEAMKKASQGEVNHSKS